ncbi:MAG: hypothetical protein LBN26_03765 [Christensenellaceae bacterium]|nr:hypothetical protein [Christensenellaceae bacterium]
MKKTLALALALMLALTLAACGGSSGGGSSTPPAGNSTPAQTEDGGSQTTEQSADDDTSTPSDESTGLDESEYTWENDAFTQMIPKPDFGTLYVFGSIANTGLSAQIRNVSVENATAYISSVKAMWKDADVQTDETYAYNAETGEFDTYEIQPGETYKIQSGETYQLLIVGAEWGVEINYQSEVLSIFVGKPQ